MGEKTTVLEKPGGVEKRGGVERTTTSLSESIVRRRESTLVIAGPEQALLAAEIEQTRQTGLLGLLFSTIGIIATLLFPVGDPQARLVFTLSLAGTLPNNLWLWHMAARRHRYNERRLLVYFTMAPIFNAGIIYYLGVFGPILAMFVLNVYGACLGYNRRVALITLIGSIVPFVVLGSLMTLGWIPDPGLMTATAHFGVVGRVVVIVIFTVFLVLIYGQARATREQMVSSVVQRDEAVRRASHREALFLEARQDLERALHAGGGGRFTEQTLGSFKLGAVLGRGAMGEVYEATHVTTGEPAAVKMLLPEVLSRPTYVLRFLREVRIAASLESPHVVQVLEVGDESAPLPYLAMERLQGEDLAQILRREERLSYGAILDLVTQVGHGLAAAAAAGIVHRDLKPQNLFLRRGAPPAWKILDFGVSKLLEHGNTLTEGEAIGTPQYMAPEQARGDAVDPRADLYALGAIAYRALTGRPPFHGNDVGELLIATVSKMPPRPSALAPLPRDVDLVLAIALAKHPADRFQSAARLTAAMEAAFKGRLDEGSRKHAAKLLAALPWTEPSA